MMMRLAGKNADGVAVRRRVGAGLGADRAFGADPVLDHDRGAERGAHLVAERAHEQVAQPAGPLRRDRPDRPRRIILRAAAGIASAHAATSSAENCRPAVHDISSRGIAF